MDYKGFIINEAVKSPADLQAGDWVMRRDPWSSEKKQVKRTTERYVFIEYANGNEERFKKNGRKVGEIRYGSPIIYPLTTGIVDAFLAAVWRGKVAGVASEMTKADLSNLDDVKLRELHGEIVALRERFGV